MVELRNVTVAVEEQQESENYLLSNIQLTLCPGEFVIVVGLNGAGKSTLLNTISGEMTPNQGQIVIDQQIVTHLNQIHRSSAIAKVHQDPKASTIGDFTIAENLNLAFLRGKRRKWGRYNRSFRRALFREKLAVLNMGLENRLDDLVFTLSGGQRQALALIMAMMTDARVLLLDEITAALDVAMAKKVMELTATLIGRERRTCLLITHDLAHALSYGDRILVLSEGKIIAMFDQSNKFDLTPALLTNLVSGIKGLEYTRWN